MEETRNPLNDLATEKELAQALGVGVGTLYGLRRKGLPFLKIGQTVMYDLVEVVAWLKSKCRRSETSDG